MNPEQHPDFARLQSLWRRRLMEDGFADIECPGDDGPLADPLEPGALTVNYHPEELARLVDQAGPILELTWSLETAARDAMWQRDIWKGLPPRARKVWALIVIASWSVTRASTFVGVDDRRGFRWVRIVKERISSRSRRG